MKIRFKDADGKKTTAAFAQWIITGIAQDRCLSAGEQPVAEGIRLPKALHAYFGVGCDPVKTC